MFRKIRAFKERTNLLKNSLQRKVFNANILDFKKIFEFVGRLFSSCDAFKYLRKAFE